MRRPACLAALSILVARRDDRPSRPRTDDSVVSTAAPCRGERLPPVTRPGGAAAPRLPARPMWLWDSPKVLHRRRGARRAVRLLRLSGHRHALDAGGARARARRRRHAGAAARGRLAHAAARGARRRADGRGARGRADLRAQGAPRRGARRRRRRHRVQQGGGRSRRLRRPALRHRAARPVSLALPRVARTHGGRPRRGRARSRRSGCARPACASGWRCPSGCR